MENNRPFENKEVKILDKIEEVNQLLSKNPWSIGETTEGEYWIFLGTVDLDKTGMNGPMRTFQYVMGRAR